jgi:hypothetical protein
VKKPKARCAGCGAEPPVGAIRCDACGEPLVFPTSFVCPRCRAESFNLNDIVERWCGRCHAFVDDPPPSPAVQKAMDRFHAALAARRARERKGLQ